MSRSSVTRRARFEALWAAHYEPVLAYALRRQPADAADIAAETFAVAWRRIDDIPPDAAPWLFAVARNVLRNAGRAERRRRFLSSRLAGEPRAAAAVPTRDAPLLRALAHLSEDDREALLLVAWEELDVSGAAAAMGCSAGAFRTRLHRARRRLERLLDEGGRITDAAPPVTASCEGDEE